MSEIKETDKNVKDAIGIGNGKEMAVVEEIKEEKKKESKWEFKESALTIGDMIQQNIPLREIFQADGVSMPIRWTNLIRLVNNRITKGEKLTTKTSLKDAIEAYSTLLTKSFL